MSEYQWKTVSVVGFDELMQALERADRKGYMSDAIKEEWEAFNWKPEQPAQQEPVAIADGTFNHNCPIGTALYTSPLAQSLTDDPLQGAVDWLLQADGEYFCTATVQRTLRIGYNRAKRLCDTAKDRAAHGIK